MNIGLRIIFSIEDKKIALIVILALPIARKELFKQYPGIPIMEPIIIIYCRIY